MFDFLTPLTAQHFNQKVEWLIEGFIAKEAATLLYAEGGVGKSYLSTAISKFAAEQGMGVLYIDYDNSLISLIERDIQSKLIDPYPAVHYVHRASSDLTSEQLLNNLHNEAVGTRYKNTLVVFDSLKNFGDIVSDKKASEIMKKMTDIRDAGATVVIISHTNKSGSNYQGSNNIRDAVDSMYRVEKTADSTKGDLRLILTSEKERLPVVDTAISIKQSDLSIMTIDIETARLNNDDKSFITQVKSALIKATGLNKTELLNEMGYEKTDKTARDRLDQFEDIFWSTKKGAKNATLYYLK